MVADAWRIHGNLVRPDGRIKPGTVTVAGGQIASVDDEDTPRRDPACPLVWTPPDSFVGPGLIDLHMHGAVGSDFMAAEIQGVRRITAFAAQHGVTGMLASTVTANEDAISAALRTIGRAMSEQLRGESCGQTLSGARLLGAHLEGPYLSQERRGGQDPASIRPASVSEFQHWATLAPIRMITVAPEAAGVGELIEFIGAAYPGVVVAAGHTNASYEQMSHGIVAGIRHFTHFMSGMSGFHHRQPGAVGAGLTDSPATVELIADLIHVHPGALALVAAVRGRDKVALVTDSVNFCGLPEGSYIKRGREYRIADGSVRMPDGTLAGSQLTMNTAVKNMAGAGVGVAVAWSMASAVPAAILGLGEQTGTLAPGRDADIAVFDKQFVPQCTIVRGRFVYNRANAPEQTTIESA